MRTYTLVFSIVVHATLACVLLFSTVLATDELPEPRRASVFVEVFSTPPPSPPPPVRPVAPRPAAVATVPLVAPTGVQPETERPILSDTFAITPGSVIGGFSVDPVLVMRDEPPPAPPTPSVPRRVGGDIQQPTKIAHVSPTYPSIARSARVSGVVILEATIDEVGAVRDVRVLRSIPLLDQAAVDAVRQWRFTPTLLNGQPVSVLMTVTVAFNLE
jgi:periplasmic protein TonB